MIASVGPSPKVEVGREDLLDPGDVVVDLRIGQQRALLGRGTTGSPTLVVPPPISMIGLPPRLLQPAQHHDLDQAADMQRLVAVASKPI